MKDIVIILPPKEHFSPNKAGAVALCVQDFVRHSLYRQQTLVIGADAQGGGFEGVDYQPVTVKRYGVLSHGLAYAWSVISRVQQLRPRLVEVHNRPRLAWLMRQFVPYTTHIALHVHNDPQSMARASTTAQRIWLATHLSAIYCVSDYVRSRFIEGLPEALHQRVHVVHNGIAMPLKSPQSVREKNILFTGRLAQTKGGLEFARAVAKVLPSLDGWKAVVVGADRHAPSLTQNAYEKEVYATLETLGDAVDMKGFLPYREVLAQYERSTIAVVPSQWHEPFGRTALEAMAHGAALIATASGGLVEVMGRGAVGVYPPSEENLAQAILTLAKDDALRMQVAKAGQEQAKHFTIEKVTQTLDRVRGSVLA